MPTDGNAGFDATEPFRVIIEHHVWATDYLLRHCAGLANDDLDLSLAGTYGAILPTLRHLIAEDRRLLDRLTGPEDSRRLTEHDDVTIRDLLDIWSRHADRWRAIATRGDRIDVTLPATDRWPEVPNAAPLVLLEAVQHGNDHRTHVCSVLGAHNMQVPFLCGWMFWRETGRVQPA